MIQGIAGTIYDREAILTERNGVTVAAHFSNAADEYAAIRDGAALVDLPWFGTLEFTGADRVAFLHNTLSNEVRNLDNGAGCHAASLNVQGKVLGDLIVLHTEDRMIVLVDGNRHEAVVEHLDRYIIADDVEIADKSTEIGAIGVTGPQSSALLEACGLPVPETLWSHAAKDGIRVVQMQLTGETTYGIFADRPALPSLWKSLVDAGATPAGALAMDAARIECGLPAAGFEITEDRLPLEIGLDEILCTSKGCYLGQEPIHRVQTRGHVNRKLFGLRLSADVPPSVPTDVVSAEKTAGEMTSSAYSPALGTAIGLAVLHVKRARAGDTLAVTTPGGPVDAEVVELPFVR